MCRVVLRPLHLTASSANGSHCAVSAGAEFQKIRAKLTPALCLRAGFALAGVKPQQGNGPMNRPVDMTTTGKTHLLQSTPDTVHWGYVDGSLKPVLTCLLYT